jgi:hypothetical protein
MRCKPGDLTYVVVPRPFNKTLDGKFVDVEASGGCDNGTRRIPGDSMGHSWMCRFHVPWVREDGKVIRQCLLYDDWLRPIRDNPGQDETLDWAPIKEKSHV